MISHWLPEAAYGVAYPIIVLVTAYYAYRFRLWRGNWGWILTGLGYMLLALLAQSIIQSIPSLVILVKYGLHLNQALLTGLMGNWIIPLSIYAGTVAGVLQEAAKFFAVKGRAPRSSLWIGYGFSIVDVVVIIASILLTLILNPSAPIAVLSIVGLLVNPLVSVMFHPGTAMFLRVMQERGSGLMGLVITIIAHSYLDSYVSYLNYAVEYGLIPALMINILTVILWASALAVSVLFLLIGGRWVNHANGACAA